VNEILVARIPLEFQEVIDMSSIDRLSRRTFLSGLVASNAAAAYAQVAGPRGANRSAGPPRRPSPPTPNVQDPKLWLPTSRGVGAGATFVESPDWLRNAPGWYIPSTVSAGACMLQFPEITFLCNLIHDFRDLPKLHDQAQSLGTSTIYLVDWFEGKPGAPPFNYWMNKGDYIPRTDMGGPAALKEGISALHAQGGRVILYVEGFIINETSHIGAAHGAQWSIIAPKGPLEQPYPGNWKPCPGAEGWLAHLEGVARRIGGYGVDGIFLDSQGFQKDWKCLSKKHGHPPGHPEVFNNGCVNLIHRVRAALREGNPQGIVFIEGPTMPPLFRFADGSLDWGIETLANRWLWDDQGKTDTLTSGYSIDDWNQIVAIGAKLACGSQFLKAPPGSSAQAFVGQFLKSELPEKPVDLLHVAQHASWGLHAWRNAGLILSVRMPGLDDFIPRQDEATDRMPNPFRHSHSNRGTLHAALEGLRPRAAAIDEALAGKQAPSPAGYVKALLAARQELAPFIDHGSSVELVRTAFPRVAGWRFTSSRGTALTAVSVADIPRDVSFPNTPGTWKDALSGEVFTARNRTLTVRIPPHRVRLLHLRDR
jgi:hypothetical protein